MRFDGTTSSAAAPAQLDLTFNDEPADFHPPRADKRERAVHIVEYSQYPRCKAGQQLNVGHTRDTSQKGMCFGSKISKEVGDLLRVTMRGIDGTTSYEGLARVAWCAPRGDNGYWIGVAKLEDTHRRMRVVGGEGSARVLERMSA